MNRTDRLVAMVLFLQGRRLVRAEDLATHFEVSLRTVYRDVAALGEAGVPICGEAGVGYSLVRGYHLPPVLFTAEEAAALFVGGEMVKRFADASLHTPADSALLKIRSVLPPERQEEIQRLERGTLIAAPHRPPAGIERDILRPIQQALVSRRVLHLIYRGRARAEETTRDIEPYGVVFAGGAWYAIAWCRLRSEFRHFRLDRIQRLEPREERFAPRPDFDLRQHLAAIDAESPRLEVRLRAQASAVERLRAESYFEVLAEEPGPHGVDLRLHVYSLDWCARWILSFGSEVEALAPPALRLAVHDLARAAANQHLTQPSHNTNVAPAAPSKPKRANSSTCGARAR